MYSCTVCSRGKHHCQSNIWCHLILFGTIWHHLVLIATIMYYLAQFGTVWYYLVLSVALVLLHSVHPWQTSLSSTSNVTEDFTPGSPVHQLDMTLHICKWLEFKISDNSLPVVFFSGTCLLCGSSKS